MHNGGTHVMNDNLCELYKTLRGGARASGEAALALMEKGDLLMLGDLARQRMEAFHPSGTASFLIDRNINYTNVCMSKCRFCAFYREKGDPEAYLLTPADICRKVEEAVASGATQVMLQGGLHPDLTLDYYEDVLRRIKARFDIFIHSFSPPEVHHLAQVSGLGAATVLGRLRDAGLDSLPGGGAEILSDRVRQVVSPEKISARRWLEIMEVAHGAGLKTTATMMMGSVETAAERVEHLQSIRDLQDRTGGFRAFIPWTFKSGNTDLGGRETSSVDYLRTLAVSRIFLDNVPNVQGSWVTQGRDIGQVSLFFGANDLGSIMLEENVVKAAGASNRITEGEMVELIRRAGKVPVQRNTVYAAVRTYSQAPPQ